VPTVPDERVPTREREQRVAAICPSTVYLRRKLWIRANSIAGRMIRMVPEEAVLKRTVVKITSGRNFDMMQEDTVTFAHRRLLSRRGFCLCCLGSATFAATGGWLTPSQVFAEARTLVDLIRSEAAKAPIKVHKLRGDVSVLEGSGGNVAVLTGRDGELLVDAGITASRPRITEALANLSSDPVKHLINTHWHFDHADGNEWLHGEGATIIAHENTKRHLAMAQRVEDWNFDFPPSPASAVPTDVFTTERVVDINGARPHRR
jgi:hypothetical protein